MSSLSEKCTVEVVFPANSSFEKICSIADKMNRKAEEGTITFKLEIHQGKHVTEIIRNIRNILKRNQETTFLVLKNDFIEKSPKFVKALKLSGAKFYRRDETTEEKNQELFPQDFLILHQLNTESEIRFEAIIRVNYNCNEKCTFCWILEDELSVPPERIKKLINDLSEKGIKDFVFTGGEPTLLKELPELIFHAKEKGAKRIILQTNGVLLADKKRVKQLVDSGLSGVFLSLHSDKEEVSEEITGLSGSFEKTVKALENFLQTDIEVVVDHVLSRENIKNVESFADFMIELNSKYKHDLVVNFAVAQPMGKYTEIYHLHTPSISDLRTYLVKAMEKLYKSPVDFIGFSMASGPPLCAVDGNMKFLQKLRKVNREELISDFVITERCAECKLTEYCWGLRKEYAAHYGTDEIKPIK